MNKKALLVIGIVVALSLGSASILTYSNHQKQRRDEEHVAMLKVQDAATINKENIAKEYAMKAKETSMRNETSMSKSGYISLADFNNNKAYYTDSKKVLFFHASWCPICQSIDKQITSEPSQIPTKTALIKTNFDTETALRQKYGVTQQYTFVQVNNDGNQIKKWSATSPAGAISQIQ